MTDKASVFTDPLAGTRAEHLERARAYHDAQDPAVVHRKRERSYFYAQVVKSLKTCLAWRRKVLDVGSGCGWLAGLLPGMQFVGVDLSARQVEFARGRYPEHTWRVGDAEAVDGLDRDFDAILLVSSLSEFYDVAAGLRHLRDIANPGTRLVIFSFSSLYYPVYKALEALGLKRSTRPQNVIQRDDFVNLLAISEWEIVRRFRRVLLPFYIPLLSFVVNEYLARLPVLRWFCLGEFVICRPLPRGAGTEGEPSVAIIVPAKNEEGNIPGLIRRIPRLARTQEVIFVDDQSTDATAQRALEGGNLRDDVQVVAGPGRGKAFAVEAGVRAASADICIILDADMAVRPEDLRQFYDLLRWRRCEVVNGTRMVYPHEGDAMRLANVLGNAAFAKVFSVLLGQRITDTLCGTKAFWRKDYLTFLRVREQLGFADRWGDYDLLFGAAAYNLLIRELPVHYFERIEGVTKMNKRIANGLRMAKVCWFAFVNLKLARRTNLL